MVNHCPKYLGDEPCSRAEGHTGLCRPYEQDSHHLEYIDSLVYVYAVSWVQVIDQGLSFGLSYLHMPKMINHENDLATLTDLLHKLNPHSVVINYQFLRSKPKE